MRTLQNMTHTFSAKIVCLFTARIDCFSLFFFKDLPGRKVQAALPRKVQLSLGTAIDTGFPNKLSGHARYTLLQRRIR
jgi:hypothetical protein